MSKQYGNMLLANHALLVCQVKFQVLINECIVWRVC